MTVTEAQVVVLQAPEYCTKYVVVAVGETVIEAPVPAAVPPQEPVNHCATAPVPSELSCAQPSQEQSHVLQQLNELLDSAVEDALNAGCLRVQTALKIQFGDAAGVFFTGHHRQVVHNAFRDYLLIEVNEIDAQVVSLMAQTSPQG